ncbi:uncharacterized protein LOC119101905 [Pollicipes pollicipes]|uniref:uncharacterized protein LOC119101905 n=1 Tax=Pollicipes pollicipes TaxID=41117 RepID=UPI00188493D3|nr:uncharacterized protein LOC119101905 [Pollicipes pollicipes]
MRSFGSRSLCASTDRPPRIPFPCKFSVPTMLLSIAVLLVSSGGVALAKKVGFGSDYGSDLTFDGVPYNQLHFELDFPYEPYDPIYERLDRPGNLTSRAKRRAAETRALFREWPTGSTVSFIFGFSIPFRPRGQFDMRFPFVFFVNELLRKLNGAYGRHFVHDQYSMYRSMETGLVEGLAMEGRGCVLRAICDAAHLDLAKFSLLGEMLSVLLTPKRSHLPEMEDYSQAFKEGKKYGNCKKRYSDCPLSLQSLFPTAWLSKKK